ERRPQLTPLPLPPHERRAVQRVGSGRRGGDRSLRGGGTALRSTGRRREGGGGQRRRPGLRRGGAAAGGRLPRAQAHRGQRPGAVGPGQGGGDGGGGEVLGDEGEGIVPREGRVAGEQLIQHAAEAVEVGGGGGRLAQRLLGSQVGGRAHHQPLRGQAAAVRH